MVPKLRSARAERLAASLALCLLVIGAAACGESNDTGSCAPDDFDGRVGGKYAFRVSVSDTEFAPKILTTQNLSHVTLTLTNSGTTPHGLGIDCLPTPNGNGCPAESCFPAEATIAGVDPGATQSVEFDVPNPEGIYTFRSPVTGDTQTGQFIIQ
jgi:hypothetical protein